MSDSDPKIYDSDPNEDTSWLLTYGDVITLLMIFFVLMFSASKISQEKFDKVAQSINQSLNRPAPNAPSSEAPLDPLDQVEKMVSDLISKASLQADMKTEVVRDGIMIELSSSSLFDSGSADIKFEMQMKLLELVDIIGALPKDRYSIVVEGHTDDVPINTSKFPSNWELSAIRALNVLHIFEEAGIQQGQMSASAFASTRPKAPNLDGQGIPIVKNRALNRRINILITEV